MLLRPVEFMTEINVLDLLYRYAVKINFNEIAQYLHSLEIYGIKAGKFIKFGFRFTFSVNNKASKHTSTEPWVNAIPAEAPHESLAHVYAIYNPAMSGLVECAFYVNCLNWLQCVAGITQLGNVLKVYCKRLTHMTVISNYE